MFFAVGDRSTPQTKEAFGFAGVAKGNEIANANVDDVVGLGDVDGLCQLRQLSLGLQPGRERCK